MIHTEILGCVLAAACFWLVFKCWHRWDSASTTPPAIISESFEGSYTKYWHLRKCTKCGVVQKVKL